MPMGKAATGRRIDKKFAVNWKPSSGGYTLIGARMSPLVTTDAGHEACKQGIGYTPPPRWNKQNTNEQRKNRDCSRPLAAVNLDANDSSKCCVHKREESSYKKKNYSGLVMSLCRSALDLMHTLLRWFAVVIKAKRQLSRHLKCPQNGSFAYGVTVLATAWRRETKKKKKIEIKQLKNLNKKKWGKPPERPSHAAASGFVVRSRDKQQQLIHGIFFSLLSAPEK